MAQIKLEYGENAIDAINWEQDTVTPLGHLKSLKVGTATFTADLTVVRPDEDTPTTVVGPISELEWGGGPADFMKISAYVTATNRLVAAQLVHADLVDTSVTFSFACYEYDQMSKNHFEALYLDGSSTISGKIKKKDAAVLKEKEELSSLTAGAENNVARQAAARGRARMMANTAKEGDVEIELASVAWDKLKSPQLYLFTISIVPGSTVQQITLATAHLQKVVKDWGVVPPT